MSGPEEPKSQIRSLPLAPHGHLIQPGHLTVLAPEDPEAVRELEEIVQGLEDPPGAGQAAALSRLCGRHPAFLDGWGRLAEVAYLRDDPVAAYAYARVGYHRGLDRLRKSGWGGTGKVQWAESTNRGFLRSLFMLMAAAAAIGDLEEAARCRQFLLDLDPDDGLGLGRQPELAMGQRLAPAALP
ncbi:MAG: DUF3151 family protein [Candidatus Dormibacteria bacterium]